MQIVVSTGNCGTNPSGISRDSRTSLGMERSKSTVVTIVLNTQCSSKNWEAFKVMGKSGPCIGKQSSKQKLSLWKISCQIQQRIKVINMFKELKKTLFKEFTESLMALIHHIVLWDTIRLTNNESPRRRGKKKGQKKKCLKK